VKNPEEKSLTGRLFVPSLVVAFFSTSIIEFLTSIFLLDVTETFFGSTNQVFIATTSQLVTLASVVSVIFAVILGALSVSYNHKKLLFLGSIAVTIGILGCLVAPSFLFMQIFFPIEGIGTTIIGAMALTLVGEFLILSERPKAVGWIMAGGSLAAILGSLVIALFFSGAANWRSYLLWFALPISLVSLTAVYLWVPSSKPKARTIKKQDFINSFKQVFLQKSAASCLIGIMFRQAAFAWAIVYYASFLRTQFGLSLSSTALLGLVGAIILATSLVTGGYLVQRIGRKRQIVSTLVASSLLLIPIAFLNDLAIILILSWVGGFIFGTSFPATTSLILEQVPESRGTMMSMSTVFVTLGMGLGTALGGAALVLYDWTGLILIFATIQLIAAAVYFFLARDPCKT
jgi:MFS transporter, DHA1 family, inner membrane transport protein